MLNEKERAEWFEAYLRSGMKFQARRKTPEQMLAWARSMSLIAEQFIDNDEPAEQAEA